MHLPHFALNDRRARALTPPSPIVFGPPPGRLRKKGVVPPPGPRAARLDHPITAARRSRSRARGRGSPVARGGTGPGAAGETDARTAYDRAASVPERVARRRRARPPAPPGSAPAAAAPAASARGDPWWWRWSIPASLFRIHAGTVSATATSSSGSTRNTQVLHRSPDNASAYSPFGSGTKNRAVGLDSSPSAASAAACSDRRLSPATEQDLPRPSRSRTFIRGGVYELPGCGPSRGPSQERWESPSIRDGFPIPSNHKDMRWHSLRVPGAVETLPGPTGRLEVQHLHRRHRQSEDRQNPSSVMPDCRPT